MAELLTFLRGLRWARGFFRLWIVGATPILLATLGLMATGERSPHDMSIAIFFVFGSLLAGTALAWALRGLRDL